MPDTPRIQCHLLDTGYCRALERIVLGGGRWRTIHCHSLVALLRHPSHGWLLWDTGYAPRLWEATRGFPLRFYRWATRLPSCRRPAAAEQLGRFGLSVGDIRRVIISHFHADHIAGLRDFPQAQFIASAAAYHNVRGRTGLQALRRATVPALLPGDFESRSLLLRSFTGPELGPLGPTCDLFGDGSLVLVSLPGHARGQLGLLAQTEGGPLFFVADGCWHTDSIRHNRPPHPIVRVFLDDYRAMLATLDALHAFSLARPEVVFIPTHCPEAFSKYVDRSNAGARP